MAALARIKDYCTAHHIAYACNEPLAAHCTFQIGGPADLFVQPASTEQIAGLLQQAQQESLALLVLGKGSNVLFADAGYRGVVLHLGTAFSGMRLLDEQTISCDSGASLSRLCLFACEHGLAGLEFAYGIPGSVGGAIYMNAGAYGGEVKDVLLSARHIASNGQMGSLAGEALQLSYRHSVYTDSGLVIAGGDFRLQPDNKDVIRARMDDCMNRRRQKQPLEFPSAGSTFKRPQGDYASALIDRCGLKGRRVGGAVVSEKHGGFVVNTGGATCADVLALIEIIRQEVQAQTGYLLECEMKIINR